MSAKDIADKYLARDGGPSEFKVDVSQRHWSLLTKTAKGVVSIVRDLSLDECKQAYERLDPRYGYTQRQYEASDGPSFSCGGGMRMGDSYIKLREVFGPPGWDRSEMDSWPSWPKFETIPLDDPRNPYGKKPESKTAPRVSGSEGFVVMPGESMSFEMSLPISSGSRTAPKSTTMLRPSGPIPPRQLNGTYSTIESESSELSGVEISALCIVGLIIFTVCLFTFGPLRA